MKKISCILFCIFLNVHVLVKTSYFEYDSSSETPTYISENDNYQEFELREVAVNSTVYMQLHQFFTHDGSLYKDIEYSEFANKYENIKNSFIESAVRENKLTRFEQLANDSYVVVGEKPLDSREPLYDCEMARNRLITLVHKFIDENEQVIRRLCTKNKLQESTSKVVWAPGCCDIQLHKNCFKQCRNNNIHSCINLLCQKPDWTENFYKNAFKKANRQKNFVQLSKIRTADCPLCTEPLRIDDTMAEQDLMNKKRGLIIDKNGLTTGGKKTRFL